MSTPIINPWVIYLISLCHNLKFISIIATLIAATAVVLIGVAQAFDEDGYCDEENIKAIRQYYMKWIKIKYLPLY